MTITLIKPGIIFFSQTADYEINLLGEQGTLVSEDFEYNSATNAHFLTEHEILAYNETAGF